MIVVPLAETDSEQRARLHGKWRNQLAKAEKCQVEVHTSSDPDLCDSLHKLLQSLESRKGFATRVDARFY